MSEKTNRSACRICGNDTDNRSYILKEMMFGLQEEFAYSECSKCECLQIVDIPRDLTKYYPASYYSYADPSERPSSGLRALMARSRNRHYLAKRNFLGRILDTWRPNTTMRLIGLANLTPASRILDVGCGAGAILTDMKEAGFDNVMGIDPFLQCDTRTSNGVSLRKISLRGMDGIWDLIMFHHSFEHMPDPAEQLAAASSLLAPEGVCLVRIPTVTSYAWQFYRTHWSQLDPPRHCFLHSKRSLLLAAARAGLHCERAIYDSTAFQFWGSELVARGIPLVNDMSHFKDPRKSIFTSSEIDAFEKRAAELNKANLGDQAAYFLRKADRTKHATGEEGGVQPC